MTTRAYFSLMEFFRSAFLSYCYFPLLLVFYLAFSSCAFVKSVVKEGGNISDEGHVLCCRIVHSTNGIETLSAALNGIWNLLVTLSNYILN